MNLRRRIATVIYALTLVVAIGIIGYVTIEGWSILDALFMTITTLSTVGYEEVHPLSTAGQIFSIILIIGGVGVMLYGLTAVVQYVIEGHFRNIMGRHRMKEKMAKLEGHIILCGYGRVGREVAHVFNNEGVKFAVVDNDQEVVERAANDGFLSLIGNATSDETLNQVGIQKAKALVAALGSDADNLYLILSAKALNPKLFVVGRASGEEAEYKLKRAGADRIISPLHLAGRRMAMLTLRPLVVDFVETTMHSRGRELVLENINVGTSSPLVGMTVSQGIKCCGAIAILAVKKKTGKLLPNPPSETLLELGDELVIIGTHEQLRVIEGSV